MANDRIYQLDLANQTVVSYGPTGAIAAHATLPTYSDDLNMYYISVGGTNAVYLGTASGPGSTNSALFQPGLQPNGPVVLGALGPPAVPATVWVGFATGQVGQVTFIHAMPVYADE